MSFISWLQSPSAVILEPPKIKSVTVSIVSPSICHEEMGIPEHLTCLLRNLYAGQEATVRTGHGTTENRKRSMSRLYIVTLLI